MRKMIYESAYWKEELFRNASWLVASLDKKRWTARSFSKLEKCLMISAYALRKLDEASKLPPEYMKTEIPVGSYIRKKSILHLMNYHDIEKHYDLENNHTVSINIRYLFNQIIHSFIFCPVFGEKNRLTGIFFNSDKSSKHNLYHIELKKLIDIIMYISCGDITSCTYTRVDDKFLMSEVIYESTFKLTNEDM